MRRTSKSTPWLLLAVALVAMLACARADDAERDRRERKSTAELRFFQDDACERPSHDFPVARLEFTPHKASS
eukprot:tig00000144_g9023.t1